MRRVLIGLLVVLVLGGGGYAAYAFTRGGAAATSDASASPTPLPAVEPAAEVIAEGKVVPARSVDLNFEGSGIVAEIFVTEGQTVASGAPLAQLDTRDLTLRVEQARANVTQAQADYDKIREGATPEQIAAAEAEIARARGSLQAAQGGVTSADIAAARAELASARARLAELEAGPKTTAVQSSQAALDEARINLESQRNALSRAKTDAELRLQTAGNTLRNAQDNYSRIYWDNRQLEELPGDLPQEAKDREEAALRAVKDAETGLEQARIAYEQAQQAEVTGLQATEARVRDAQARHDQLLAGADNDQIVAARAQVVAAQARLSKLTGTERAGNLNAAAAGVTAAEARLAEVQAPATEATLASAAARVETAKVALKQAELALDKATLRAPFAGTVVEVNLEVGEVPSPAAVAMVVADMEKWEIETDDLTELSVVKISEGDQAIITFDALPGFELPGHVSRIKELGKNRQGDIVYTVVIEPDSWDARLRWNMTAAVTIK